MAVSNIPSTPYAILFRTFIEQALKRSLAQVQDCLGPLPTDMRDQALHALSFGLKHTTAWPLTRSLLLVLAPKIEQIGHRHDWLAILQTAYSIGEKAGDLDFLAECQLQMAILHRLLSEFAEARRLVAASIENFIKLKQLHNQARACNELAWLEQLEKNYDEAVQSLEQALTLLAPEDRECGMSYRVYGMIMIGLQRYAEAETYHRAALAIFQTHGDTRRTAWSLQNVALALSRQQQYQAALVYYEQASAQLSKLSDLFHWAVVRFNKALAYSFTHQYEQAIPCYQEAEAVFLQLDEKFYLSRLYTDLGLDLLEISQSEKAEQAFQASIHLAEKLNDISWQLNAMDGLAMTYLKQEKYADATQVLEKASNALPSIQNASNYEYLLHSINQHWAIARAATTSTTG